MKLDVNIACNKNWMEDAVLALQSDVLNPQTFYWISLSP